MDKYFDSALPLTRLTKVKQWENVMYTQKNWPGVVRQVSMLSSTNLDCSSYKLRDPVQVNLDSESQAYDC